MKILNSTMYLRATTFYLICLLFSWQAFAQERTNYYDDFDKNEGGWSEESTVKSSTKMVYGHYEMWHKRSSGGYCYYKDFYMQDDADFYYESKVMQTLGEDNHGFGLLWGAKGANDCYNFMISSNGYYNVGEWKGGKYTAIKSWTKISGINGKYQYNTLAVKKEGDRLYFFINGNQVYQMGSKPFKGFKFGYNLKAAMKVKADYLKLEYSRQKINLVKDANKGYVKVNLGSNINSKYTEKSPKISHDGKTLYYTRAKHPSNTGDKDDAWLSNSMPGDNWSRAEKMPYPINNQGHNFVVSISPDNNTLLLGNTYNKDGSDKGKGLSITHRTASGWEVPEEVKIDNYYNDNKYVNFCLAPSGKVLIMAIERDDSKGDQDLYYSELKSDGSWTTPKSMGNKLNTIDGEFGPFLAADNRTLYFSSYGHPGYGSADVFVSKRIGNGWTNWTEPENLGPEINTDVWDAYFTVPADGKYAYLVSKKGAIGKEDIFRIKIREDELDEETEPSRDEILVKIDDNEIEEGVDEEEEFVKEEVKEEDKPSFVPDPVVVIYGRVLDAKTEQPLNAKLFYEDLDSKTELGIANSNPSTGEYKIILPYGEHYGFTAESKKYLSVSHNVNIKGSGKYIEVEQNFYLTKVEVGKPVRINNVFFARSKPQLLSKSFPELDRLVTFMKDNPSMEIRLEGHTDGLGNPVELMKLSWDRVAAVKKYLTDHGIATNRIEGKGYGRSRPVAPNNTEDNRKKNRRVEFVITNI